MGLSNHVPMRPAVTSRIVCFDFDAVCEFFRWSSWADDWLEVGLVVGLEVGLEVGRVDRWYPW